MLARVALTLKSQVRPFDCVARWGGEEFTVVLAPPVDADDALMICERLRRAVQQATVPILGLDRKEHRGSVTVSIRSVQAAVCPPRSRRPAPQRASSCSGD